MYLLAVGQKCHSTHPDGGCRATLEHGMDASHPLEHGQAIGMFEARHLKMFRQPHTTPRAGRCAAAAQIIERPRPAVRGVVQAVDRFECRHGRTEH